MILKFTWKDKGQEQLREYWRTSRDLVLDNKYDHSSVQFSCSVMSDSLQPHESQHTRPSCPSPTPGVHSDSCPSSQWCHPAISSSVVPFSSCPQSLPASESFPMSQLFAWGGQSTIPSKEITGLISFKMDWLDLLSVHHKAMVIKPSCC